VTVYCWLSIAEDEASARDALLENVRKWRARNLYPRLYELAELPTADELTGEHLPRVAAVGTPGQCADQLRSLHDAGADTIVLQAVGDDPLGPLERAKREMER
jgi:alkanesulfonate monooxygenase SsuD/methylene tetrahydromethanopterin reductase-like flavin-dependent oxidoreductase (luciferase family)